MKVTSAKGTSVKIDAAGIMLQPTKGTPQRLGFQSIVGMQVRDDRLIIDMVGRPSVQLVGVDKEEAGRFWLEFAAAKARAASNPPPQGPPPVPDMATHDAEIPPAITAGGITLFILGLPAIVIGLNENVFAGMAILIGGAVFVAAGVITLAIGVAVATLRR